MYYGEHKHTIIVGLRILAKDPNDPLLGSLFDCVLVLPGGLILIVSFSQFNVLRQSLKGGDELPFIVL
jgi:hypothetical protein